MAEITLRAHLTKIAKDRWKNTSDEDRTKHGQLMNAARWKDKKEQNKITQKSTQIRAK